MHDLAFVQPKIWRLPQFNNLELLCGRRLTQSFPRHMHECYAVGIIEQGALGYFYRGENIVATPGVINLCVPGEAHTGQPAGDAGWSYRMFYLDVTMLQRVVSELADRSYAPPFFAAGAIDDPVVAHQLRQAHCTLERAATPVIEHETALLVALAALIRRHADDPPVLARIGAEPRAVTQIKDYCDAHYAEDVSLDTLAHLTGLSRYHLVRVFAQSVGIPPHTYLRQVRIRQAKRYLVAGHAIAEVAVA
ncbi:MAG: AraC family transcriptional regulator, partial [Roseiflexaceae bacterium]|nr:AraC family transcriptional regulator [Roseiflexaceae bacterium]